MLRDAFKEWAGICQALGEGKQSLIIRKGGISENAGEFRVEFDRFWLFPTYTHQQQQGLRPEAGELLELVESGRPPPEILRLQYFAEVMGVFPITDLPSALALEPFHFWSQETIKARFAYRQPGLFVLPVRVFQAAQTLEIPNRATYDGCRSWVALDESLSTDNATAVLPENFLRELVKSLEKISQNSVTT